MSSPLRNVFGLRRPTLWSSLLAALACAGAGCGKTGLPLDVGRGSDEGPLQVEPPASAAGATGRDFFDAGEAAAAGAGGRARRNRGVAGAAGGMGRSRADLDAGRPDRDFRDGGLTDSGFAGSSGSDPDASTPNECEGGAFAGSITISTPRDLDRVRGCTSISGDLSIYTAQLDSLSGLERLRVVQGSLSIAPDRDLLFNREISRLGAGARLQDLSGLAGLEQVGGTVWLVGLPFSNLAGLSKLQHASLHLEAMPALETLDGLGASTFEAVGIVNCPALRALDGLRLDPRVETVELSNLPALGSIAALRGMREVGILTFQRLPSLASLDGLQDVQSVSSHVAISDCDALTDLRGFDGVTSGNFDLALVGNDGLTSTTGFLARGASFGFGVSGSPNLTTITNLATAGGRVRWLILSGLPRLAQLPPLEQTSIDLVGIETCDALQDLTGFGALTSIGQLTLVDDTGLRSLKGLDAVTQMGTAEFGSLASLTHLQGLEKLTQLSVLRVFDNPALVDLVGLDALTSVDGIELEGNHALQNVRGLGKVQTVRDLSVYQNSVLRSLDGLAGLTEVGLLHVGFNPLLTSLMGAPLLARAVRIEVMSNQTLASLAGLEALTSVGDMLINSNPSLTSLRALNALTTAASLEISGNRRLPQCEVDWLSGRAGVTAIAADNGPAGTCAP